MLESKTKAIDKGNCGVARPRGKEAGVKTASPRTEMCYKADDRDELAQHNEVQDSLSEVKHGVVPGKFINLLGETCPASHPSHRRSNGTLVSNREGESAGVSRGHSSAGNEPGVNGHLEWCSLKAPEGLTHARRTELIRTVETAGSFKLEMALDAGSSDERSRAAEKDCGQGSGARLLLRVTDNLSVALSQIGTARYGPVRRVVWGPGV